MAEMVVKRRSGEEVVLKLGVVDRTAHCVTITIPDYNAGITFEPSDRFVRVRERFPLKTGIAVLHVSQTVYQRMAWWANSILRDPR